MMKLEVVRVVATNGILGYGFPGESLAKAMQAEPYVHRSNL